REGAAGASTRDAGEPAARSAAGGDSLLSRRTVARGDRGAPEAAARHREIADAHRLPENPRRARGPAMTITHHLDDATLMSFAAGSLPDALSAVAAAHVAMCARCSGEVAALESIGGVLLGELSPALLNKVEIAPAGGQASAGPISRDNA